MINNKVQSSFSDLMIAFLLSAGSSKIMRDVLYERLQEKRKLKKNEFSQNLYRLKKRGLIKVKNDIIIFSPNELRKIQKINLLKVKLNNQNKLIMIFDIPEKDRRTRDWLRNQIKFWDFKMIQRSVWLGTGPLPKEFNDRLKFLKIDKCVKVFNIQKKK